jgi:hypothetical protein
VECLPTETKHAMLTGIRSNRIIIGAYTDSRGGVCPMLAAHRCGGRTSFASFARAWDEFTNAPKRPRRASRREVAVLRSYLEMSLLADDMPHESLSEIASEIRAGRRATASADPRSPAPPPPDPEKRRPRDRFRVTDLRRRRGKTGREVDLFEATIAAGADRSD